MGIGVFQLQFLSRSIRHFAYGSLLLGMGLWCSGCTPLIMAPTPAASLAEPNAEPVEAWLIVQVTYPSVEVLNSLAGELDVWEVDRAAQTFIARVTLAQYDVLLQQELTVTLDCAKMRQYEQALNLTLPVIAQMMQEQCPESSP